MYVFTVRMIIIFNRVNVITIPESYFKFKKFISDDADTNMHCTYLSNFQLRVIVFLALAGVVCNDRCPAPRISCNVECRSNVTPGLAECLVCRWVTTTTLSHGNVSRSSKGTPRGNENHARDFVVIAR